jgi:pyridoxal 5'-phosphate synthase pdxS subunit
MSTTSTKSPLKHVPGFTAEELVSKIGFCSQLKGGVIMDVINDEQARIAEEAGACAVMALERVPADIRKHGGVARASDPTMIASIQKAVSIPVMAKVRIGHFVEAQMLEAMEVDCIDESEVLTPADDQFQIDKRAFKTPFVCGCRDLGEALRRIHEGAAMIRTKGEAGTGNVVEAVRHMRALMSEIRGLRGMDYKAIEKRAVELRVPTELVAWVAEAQKLPVPNFSAGGVATPADAALMMQLGAEAVFVGSGIFKSGNPVQRAKAIVRAVTHFNDPKVLVEVSKGLGEPMVGIDINVMPANERYAGRGI